MPNRNQLSFPPLVQSQQWTSKSIASWPGAEFTRRNKLRTTCIEPYNAGFLGELEETLGKETFGRFTDSLQPTTSHTTHRGRPPPEKGKKAIKAAYTLPRAKVEGESEVDLSASLASTTLSLSGRPSSSRFLETFATPYGPAPSYMFEDREKMGSLSDWFGKYGRPEPSELNKKLYTSWVPSNKRVCGEMSAVQVMKRGELTR
mmetsp:Transcript_41316/g.93382  ORF Transcript_41316/g.93382 Transcript_41316/m.93382 type:complete len:203 (-) Transcript_41316:235-843(-)